MKEGSLKFTVLMMMMCASILVFGQESDKVYSADEGVSLPSLVKEVKPEYSQEAKDQHIQGTVVLSCVVTSDGSVAEVRVVRSLEKDFGLDREAVKALKQWTFKPGMKDRRPVAVKISVEMKFSLKD